MEPHYMLLIHQMIKINNNIRKINTNKNFKNQFSIGGVRTHESWIRKAKMYKFKKKEIMVQWKFEPVTFRLQVRHSAAELHFEISNETK